MKPLTIFAVALVATGFNAQAQTSVAATPTVAPTPVAVAQAVLDVQDRRFQDVPSTQPVAAKIQSSQDALTSQSLAPDEINVGLEDLHPRAIPSYHG